MRRPVQGLKFETKFQPKQQKFFDLLQAVGLQAATWLGFGGARGGAKSATVRRCALALAMMFPGISLAIIRRVYGDLKINHIDPLLAEVPDLSQFYRVGDHELCLPDTQAGPGSRIVFNYAETAAEVNRKFWGPEFAFIFIDQAEQFSGEELTIIKTANRWPGKPAGFCKTGLFFNPGGVGTEWLRRVFYLKQYHDNERPGDFAFIQAYGWDNFEWFRGQVPYGDKAFYKLPNETRFDLFISQTSEGRKLDSLPPSLRAGHLLGSFDSFAGQYFAGVWDESKCILPIDIAERLIQPWWNHWLALDWGFAHHSCALWCASGKLGPAELHELGIESTLPIDVVIVYREIVVNETPEADLAQMIVDRTPEYERNSIKHFWLSPDAFAKRGSEHTIAEQLNKTLRTGRLPYAAPADNDRIGGWRLLYDGLRRTCSVRGSQLVTEKQTGPMLLISGNCPQLIASIPLLIRDPKNLEDVLKTSTIADDCADCWRYAYKSMMNPRNSPPVEVTRQAIMQHYLGPQTIEAPGEFSFNSQAANITNLSIAMKKFEVGQQKRSRLSRRTWR